MNPFLWDEMIRRSAPARKISRDVRRGDRSASRPSKTKNPSHGKLPARRVNYFVKKNPAEKTYFTS
jgi:hypothetical protein